METSSATTAISAWKPAVPGVREVLEGDFGEHAYPPHTHDTWTLFVVDAGAIRYDLGRTERGADPAMASILPPYVVHDGRPATTRGYETRVIYLEPEVIGEAHVGRAVDAPVLPDARLRTAVSQLHNELHCSDDALAAETHLAFVAERIRELLGEAPIERAPAPDLAERARAILDARLFEPVTMEALAAELGSGPTQVARAFSEAFGIAPHTYVVGRRLDAARDRILDGRPLADVAAEVGFYDQAHLTHRFRRFLGTTPGRFAEGPRALP